jgi:hypothetical protein
MVEKRFLMRSVDQQVQDVLEPGRFAQTCQHNMAPGPHTVNILGRQSSDIRPFCFKNTCITRFWSPFKKHLKNTADF